MIYNFQNETEANDFFKFMFVRHPVDRLLSCYFDKVLDVKSNPELTNFRKRVLKRAQASRKARKFNAGQTKTTLDSISELNQTLPTLDDFIEFILSQPLELGTDRLYENKYIQYD